jgi:phospholipid/cholesterol/gamma-HCH transport system permease protein
MKQPTWRGRVAHALESIGSQGLILGQALRTTVAGEVDAVEFGRAMIRLGLYSVPVVFSTALFVGGMMVVQSIPLLERFGAESLLGWGAGFGILREIGPILTGLMISGRVGANNTAELGTLSVTSQVDGLRVLAIDPAGYLIAPRVLAFVLTTTLGTLVSMAVALFGAALSGLMLLGVSPDLFWNSLTGGLLGVHDILHGLIKAFVFGLAIATCSTSFGLRARGGAPGVGRAVSSSVVVSALLIFLLDALVSFADTASS